MTGLDLLGLAALVLFLVSMLFYASAGRRWPVVFRPLAGLDALGEAIERAVEDGKRVHLSLGTGSVIGSDSAPALAGLATLSKIAAITSMSDKPVVATTGDGAMALLAQDTLRTAYDAAGARGRYEPTSGRLLGPSPFSYVATLPTMLDTEDVAVHLMVGSFGVEGGLAADFGERQNALVLAGTDDVQSQALLYAIAEHPLIGEEVFATGAYLDVSRLHRASLRAQDAIRFLLVVGILGGTLLMTLGLWP
ncbi:MAG TPA: DUF6754 domain-containing protein [Anaerolineales bacterium]|jgi:hypothetical protein